MDESSRQGFWRHAIGYGLQYYVSGRFAAASGFTPVSANILHHAAELLLKACLAYDDSLDTIRKYGARGSYGHSLVRPWEELKRRKPHLAAVELDAVVSGLDKFEDIRYPDTLIKHGATITIDIFDVDSPLTGDRIDPATRYALNLPRVDRLMGVLFEAANANPPGFLPEIEGGAKRARLYYPRIEMSLFGRAPSDEET